MNLSIIVAVTENGVIGCDNALPWHISEDLKYFKKTTMGKPIVMGRKTFESIGRPLPGRTNIVVTRNAEWRAEGVVVVPSLEEALSLAELQCETPGEDELFVIGGEQIYRLAISLAKKIYLTRIYADVNGDAFFPGLPETDWQLVSEAPGKEAADYKYAFCVYERR